MTTAGLGCAEGTNTAASERLEEPGLNGLLWLTARGGSSTKASVATAAVRIQADQRNWNATCSDGVYADTAGA